MANKSFHIKMLQVSIGCLFLLIMPTAAMMEVATVSIVATWLSVVVGLTWGSLPDA